MCELQHSSNAHRLSLGGYSHLSQLITLNCNNVLQLEQHFQFLQTGEGSKGSYHSQRIILPLKKSPGKSGGGETIGESKFTMDFITISRAFLPYCAREKKVALSMPSSVCASAPGTHGLTGIYNSQWKAFLCNSEGNCLSLLCSVVYNWKQPSLHF